MPIFDCALNIGYPADDAETPIVDENNNAVPWANLNGLQRMNILMAIHAPIQASLSQGDPGNGGAPFFDLWDSRQINIASDLTNDQLEDALMQYLDARLAEASSVGNLQTKKPADNIRYTNFDSKVVCGHEFTVETGPNAAWQIQNVQFDSDGAGTMWSVDVNHVRIGIDFNPSSGMLMQRMMTAEQDLEEANKKIEQYEEILGPDPLGNSSPGA